jgi:hypothetical protein
MNWLSISAGAAFKGHFQDFHFMSREPSDGIDQEPEQVSIVIAIREVQCTDCDLGHLRKGPRQIAGSDRYVLVLQTDGLAETGPRFAA